MTDLAKPMPATPAGEGGASVTDSGSATANHGGTAVSGIVNGGIKNEHHEHYHAGPASPIVWPVQIGRPPALASAFQPRESLRAQIRAARSDGSDVVLTQHSTSTAAAVDVLAGGGGVGKTQLAAWFAHHAIREQTADLVMWVTAGTEDQIIAAYARAATRLNLPGAIGADPAGDATAFCEWLHTTDRRWIIVLDDVTDAAHLQRWWPPAGGNGWTIATTRLRTAAITSSGRRRINIDVYALDESMAYLAQRLTSEGLAQLLDDQTADLTETLGHLPLALAHAAAYMINEAETCTAYLNRYTTGRQRLTELMPADAEPDAYGRPIDVTLLLNLTAANATTPIGLARPALELAALLDPAGHPDDLWTTPAITEYLTAQRNPNNASQPDEPATPVTTDQARAVVRLLHRYGLLTHTPTDGPRAVRIHALTARATRERTTTNTAVTAHAAADALKHLWPANDHTLQAAPLVQALRANTTALHTNASAALWQPDGHPLLYTVGNSLLNAGLHTTATTYWHTLTQHAHTHLGPDHPDTLTARANLAFSYWQAGRTTEAITIQEQVLTDRERILGSDHPNTIRARGNLAASYRQAGRTNDAVTLNEQVLADSERILGPDHPATIRARGNLAVSYQQTGRTNDALTLNEQVATDRERILGPEHPDTIRARANLAASYRQAGRTSDAIPIEEQVLTDFERILGPEHPDTVTARGNLAASYGQAGRTSDAIPIEEQVLADRERILGPDHPDTLNARGNLAASCWQAGRTNDAITLLRAVVSDSERVLGPQHPSTITAIAALHTWTTSQ